MDISHSPGGAHNTHLPGMRGNSVVPGVASSNRIQRSSGTCIGSIVPSPRITFLNSARDTEM